MPGLSRRPAGVLLIVAFCVPVLGCATAGPRPGTGDLSFRLRWEGPADLDLHVEDPEGRHVGVFMPWHLLGPEEQAQQQAARRAADEDDPELSGILDVDCNASPAKLCRRPIENVYWPTGTAPRGTYRARVVLFQELHSDEVVPFVLEIRRGDVIVRSVPGRVGDAERISPWVEADH